MAVVWAVAAAAAWAQECCDSTGTLRRPGRSLSCSCHRDRRKRSHSCTHCATHKICTTFIKTSNANNNDDESTPVWECGRATIDRWHGRHASAAWSRTPVGDPLLPERVRDLKVMRVFEIKQHSPIDAALEQIRRPSDQFVVKALVVLDVGEAIKRQIGRHAIRVNRQQRTALVRLGQATTCV